MKRVLVCVLVLCAACSCAEAALIDGPVKLGIVKFKTRAEGISEAQAAAIGDIFTRMLTGSKTITVVERDQIEEIAKEHKLNMDGLVTDDTASQAGKFLGCNYMLIGAVTRYEQANSETDAWLLRWRKFSSLATVDARIVDVETTKVVLSLSENGTNVQKGGTFNIWGVEAHEKKVLEGIEGGAINDAVSRLAFKLKDNLTGECVQVVEPGTKEIRIDLGTIGGAKIDGLYRVYAEGQEIFDSDGQSLGREMHDIAVVKITKVQPKFSNAALASGGAGRLALAQKGDKLFPVTQQEMEEMIANKVFVKDRPRIRRRRHY